MQAPSKDQDILVVAKSGSNSRRTRRTSEQISSLIARIGQTNFCLLNQSPALEALELILTHPAPPKAVRPMCDQLQEAAKEGSNLAQTAELLWQAATMVPVAQSFLVEPDLIRIAILEHAQTLCPSVALQLDIIRAYLRYAGTAASALDMIVPAFGEIDSTEHQRAAAEQGIGRHASDVARAALRATGPCPSRPLTQWSTKELQAAVIAVRALYSLVRQGIHPKGRHADLRADFEQFGAPTWRQLIWEINGRGDAVGPWSVEHHEESQAQLLLSLSVKSPFQPRRPVSDESATPALAADADTHVVCRQSIPRSSDRCDQEEVQRHLVLEQPLPIAATPVRPVLEERFHRLAGEFPWARETIEAIFADLHARAALGVRALGMPPTLLVGPPGSGKSRLARRLADELHLPCLDLPLGGTTDSKVLSGTSRGWSSGRPSDLATLLAARRSASALVILDEIDKAVGSTSNDSGIQSYLLGMLEPETARRHRDNFLKTECDFSRVLWIATANRLSALPVPLLSRFRVLLVGQPRPEHMQAVAENVIADLAASWGVERAAMPEPTELALQFDQLGSVRQVRLACETAIARWAMNIHRH